MGKPGRGSGGGVSSASVLEAPAGVAGLDDVAVVGQAVEHGGGHLGVAEHLGPIGEGQVGGNEHRRVLVEFADQVEQQLAAGLAERQITQLVDDDEIVAQQLLGQPAAATGGLFLFRLIDQIDTEATLTRSVPHYPTLTPDETQRHSPFEPGP